MLTTKADVLIFILRIHQKVMAEDVTILDDYSGVAQYIIPENIKAITESLVTTIRLTKTEAQYALASQLINAITGLTSRDYVNLVLSLQKVFRARQYNEGLIAEDRIDDGARELILSELAKTIDLQDTALEYAYYEALTNLAISIKDEDLVSQTILKLEALKSV
jgi:hypothetical protein